MTSDPQVAVALAKMESMSEDIAEIKGAVQQVAIAIQKLAVVEERQMRAGQDIDRAFRAIDGHETRIVHLERVEPASKRTTEWMDKVIWLIVGGVVVAILKLVL